jgi:hypothetical protein
MSKESRTTPLTLMEELHIQFEARLLANHGKLVPLSQSVDPSPELIERVRQRFLRAQEDEDLIYEAGGRVS